MWMLVVFGVWICGGGDMALILLFVLWALDIVEVKDGR